MAITTDEVQAALAAFEDSLQHAPTRRPEWMHDAACREHDARLWFTGRGESIEPARAICSSCLARRDCLAYALDGPWWLEGVWAGTSTRGCRKMTKAERESIRLPA